MLFSVGVLAGNSTKSDDGFEKVSNPNEFDVVSEQGTEGFESQRRAEMAEVGQQTEPESPRDMFGRRPLDPDERTQQWILEQQSRQQQRAGVQTPPSEAIVQTVPPSTVQLQQAIPRVVVVGEEQESIIRRLLPHSTENRVMAVFMAGMLLTAVLQRKPPRWSF